MTWTGSLTADYLLIFIGGRKETDRMGAREEQGLILESRPLWEKGVLSGGYLNNWRETRGWYTLHEEAEGQVDKPCLHAHIDHSSLKMKSNSLHSFICLFSKHAVNAFIVPGSLLGAWDIWVKKIEILSQWSLYASGERQTINKRQNK